MKSTLTKKEDNLVSLNIVVPAKEADSAYNILEKEKLQKLL